MTTTQPHALLLHLAPPTRLIDWLEKVFSEKQAKGEIVPAEFTARLTTWQDIRTDAPCPSDAAPPTQWAAVGERVRG